MITARLASLWLALCLGSGVFAQRPVKLALMGHVNVAVAEPSDMALVPGSRPPRFFVASDNGYVAEIAADGSLVRRSANVAFDLEGILWHQGELLMVDERTRRILWMDPVDLTVKRRLTIPYAGGRNKGYEAIVWNPVRERFVLITERDPILVIELDRDMRVVNEIEFDRSVRDISSATWAGGVLWLLSDMDMLVMRCDPQDYRIMERFEVPVLNPEGLAFDEDGTLYILSDDRQRLYRTQVPGRAQ
jgi:uncharacterized protein YjiK